MTDGYDGLFPRPFRRIDKYYPLPVSLRKVQKGVPASESWNHQMSSDRGHVSRHHRLQDCRFRRVCIRGHGTGGHRRLLVVRGCPGKRAVLRAKMLVDRGAEAVVFASCMKKGNPIDFPCPISLLSRRLWRKNWDRKSKSSTGRTEPSAAASTTDT